MQIYGIASRAGIDGAGIDVPQDPPVISTGLGDMRPGKGTRPGGDVLPPVPDWALPDRSFSWWKGGR